MCFLEARAHFQVRPRTVIHFESAVELRPGFFILHIDILVAEYPPEGYRRGARARRGVVGVTEVITRSAVHSIQRVARTGAGSRVRLGDVLRRRPAIAPGVTHLGEEREVIRGIPGAIQVDEIRGRRFIGARDLVINAVMGAPRPERSWRTPGCCSRPRKPASGAWPEPEPMKLVGHSR